MSNYQDYSDPYGLGAPPATAVPRRTRYNPAGTPNPSSNQFIPPTAEPLPPEQMAPVPPPLPDPNTVNVPPPAAAPATPPAPAAPTYMPGVPNTNFGGGNPQQQNRQISDTFGTPAPAGFDATKWADQSHLSDKYLSGHIEAASGSIDDVVAALGARTPGWKKINEDTIQAPDGSRFDIWFDVGGPNQRPQWLQIAGPGGAPMPAGGGAGAGAGAAGAGGAGGAGNPHAADLDAVLQDFLAHGGLSPTGEEAWSRLMEMAETGGLDLPALSRRLNTARGDAAGQFQGLLADARDQLAARGMASQPGVEQGGEHTAIGRISDSVGRNLADTITGIETNAFDKANENVMSSLAAATGLSEDAAHNILTAVGKGTERDQLFAEVAFRQLSLNEDWNKFLATNGLQRDQLEYEIAHGDTEQLIHLIEVFMGIANTSAQGHH